MEGLVDFRRAADGVEVRGIYGKKWFEMEDALAGEDRHNGFAENGGAETELAFDESERSHIAFHFQIFHVVDAEG